MRILAVDDERMALNILTRAIREAAPDAEVIAFQTVSETLAAFASGGAPPDVAFLDIEMPGMTGLELAKRIKALAPRVNIVFVTGYSQYALEALSLRSSGYVMKPVDREQVLAELDNLRNPPAPRAPQKRVRIQCFGDFDIFVEGKAIAFPRAKSKEMLAYLVDRRGANCASGKIAEALWEDGQYDRARQKLFSTVRADMLKSLRQVGAEEIVKRTNNALAIVPEAVACDYYMALAGDAASIHSFVGEYMAAYSWAEFTTAALAANLTAAAGLSAPLSPSMEETRARTANV